MGEIKDVEQPASKWAKTQGIVARKFTSPGRRGVPDDLYFKDGKCCLIEFKKPGKTKLDPLQVEEIRILREDGGMTVFVCDHLQAAKICLTEFFDL